MRLSRNNSRGSITLVALSLAVVIGISLASYLALCQQSLVLSTRTLQLSKARQLAETGLEEALWSLNTAANPSTTVSTTAWSNATWTTSGADKNCTLTGYNMGNGATGELTITIANFNGPTPATTPAIPAPNITATATVTAPNLGTFTKTLTATTKPAPLFPNAIGVSNGYVLLFGGTEIDSWDSDYDPAAVAPTPNRDYNISTPRISYSSVIHPPASTSARNYAAIVAAPSITLNNSATIYGYAATSGNSISTSANCLIKGPTTPALINIDQARVSKSSYVPNFQVTAPSTSTGTWNNLPSNASWGASQTIGTVGGPTSFWTTDTAESGMSTSPNGPGTDLFLDNSKTLIINGPVVLVVNEDFELKTNAKIQITATGRLELYVRDDVVISDTAGFQNLTDEPKNLAFFCTNEYSNNFSFIYSSTSIFNGVLYSADTDQGMTFTVSPEIYGAISTGYTPSFDAGGYTKIHYDLALQYLPKGWFKGVTTPFMITQLTETP